MTYASIDEYIAQFPPEVREKLEALRSVIRESAPGAEERISYQMPAFALHGILVYFAAHKNHLGFYPTASGIAAFHPELSRYKVTKGTVQFPLDEPLPCELIGKIVRFRVAENLARAEERTRRKR
ncbi:MAG: iron chaperone [Chitinophagales bacterium]